MYCPKCGAPNEDDASKCIQCRADLGRVRNAMSRRRGGQRSSTVYRGRFPNYLVHAILCTAFCCLPFGIVAIVHAAQVDSKLAAGDIYGAKHASNQALKWCEIAVFTGLAGGAIWFLLALGNL